MKQGPITFEEFIEEFTINHCVQDSKTARYIYDNIICREDVRIKMTEFSDVGITALTACVNEIEQKCLVQDSDLSLSTKVVRQTIGRMCAASLNPLGYTPYKQGRVNAGHSKFFTSAKVYQFTGNATEKVEKRIVSVNTNC